MAEIYWICQAALHPSTFSIFSTLSSRAGIPRCCKDHGHRTVEVLWHITLDGPMDVGSWILDPKAGPWNIWNLGPFTDILGTFRWTRKIYEHASIFSKCAEQWFWGQPPLTLSTIHFASSTSARKTYLSFGSNGPSSLASAVARETTMERKGPCELVIVWNCDDLWFVFATRVGSSMPCKCVQ